MNLKKLAIGALTLALLTLVPVGTVGAAQEADQVTLTEDNLLSLDTEITQDTMGPILLKAKELDQKLSGITEKFGAKKKPIYVFIYSPGGSIQTGLETIEQLKGLGRPVHTVTVFAASMAFQTVQALGDRLIIANGVLMSHRAYGGSEGQFGGEAPAQLDNRNRLWKQRMDDMDAQTVKRTNGKQTMASYQKAYSSELWLTGKEAVDQGYADKVVTIHCDKTLKGTNKHSLSVMMGLIQIEYETDKCPINTSPLNIKIALSTNKGKVYLNDFQSQGGSFDPGCAYSNPDGKKLCAADPKINMASIEDVLSKFKSSFYLNRTSALPYSW